MYRKFIIAIGLLPRRFHDILATEH